MKNEDDFITEDAIQDLIKYTEDEESNTAEIEEDDAEIQDDISDEAHQTDAADSEKAESDENLTEELSSDNEDNSDDTDNSDDEYLYEDYEFPDELDDQFEKENKGGCGKGIVIGIIVGVIAAIVYVGINSGAFAKFASNFSNNFSRIFPSENTDEIVVETVAPDAEYNTQISKSMLTSLEGANDAEFVKYGKGLICAKMNYMSYINENGEIEWEINTAVVTPILKSEGDYILLAENGSNKICLYNGSKLIYDTNDPDTIVNASLSSRGDVVVVTNKQNYKGGISVYNKSGAQIFSWSSGSDMVMCADISASSRRVAVALLNTENTAKTVIQLFKVNEKESYSKTDIENTVIFDMNFTNNILNAVGDNRIVGISESGKVIYNNLFDDVQLTHSAIDTSGNMLLSFDNGNIPMINMYNKKGALKETVTLAGVADFIDINGKKILYNKGRDTYFGNINAKVMTKYTATMDIKKLFLISDNTYVIVYSNSVEIIEV